MKALVTCPNCKGKDSSRWPFGPCTICEGSGKTTELRELKAHLRDLSEAVSTFLRDVDAVMSVGGTPDNVGRTLAEYANKLDMANDRVRYFALGVDYRTDDKGSRNV